MGIRRLDPEEWQGRPGKIGGMVYPTNMDI